MRELRKVTSATLIVKTSYFKIILCWFCQIQFIMLFWRINIMYVWEQDKAKKVLDCGNKRKKACWDYRIEKTLWETLVGTRIPGIFCFLKSWQVYIIHVNVYVSLADQIYQAVVIAVFCKLKDKTNSWFDPVQGVITHIHVIEVNLSNLKSFL